MTLPTLKYSKRQVNKAGKTLVDYVGRVPTITKVEMREALDILNNWRTCHIYPINTFQSTLRRKLKSIDNNALVAQRLKRIPSIVVKLIRFRNMQLSRMQDIGGLRAVVSSLTLVRELENNYKKSRFKHELYTSKDYIDNPKDSGYRSVHLVYKYKNPPCPNYNGLFIELQIRTRLQHAWATAVEIMGTYINQALKSSEGPKHWLDFFSLASSAFAHMENTSPVPGYEKLSKDETFQKTIQRANNLDVQNKLFAFSIATKHIRTERRRGSYYLITLNLDNKSVYIQTFSKEQLYEANDKYLKVEEEITKGKNLQAVLVSTGSIKYLKQAYPNYFLDSREFIKHINQINQFLNNH